LQDLARRTGALLDKSRPFASMLRDTRLAMEVAAIQKLAERLIATLLVRDPLSERVHLRKSQMLVTGAAGAASGLWRSLFARKAPAFGW
jgi:hypothetical protein